MSERLKNVEIEVLEEKNEAGNEIKKEKSNFKLTAAEALSKHLDDLMEQISNCESYEEIDDYAAQVGKLDKIREGNLKPILDAYQEMRNLGTLKEITSTDMSIFPFYIFPKIESAKSAIDERRKELDELMKDPEYRQQLLDEDLAKVKRQEQKNARIADDAAKKEEMQKKVSGLHRKLNKNEVELSKLGMFRFLQRRKLMRKIEELKTRIKNAQKNQLK